MSITERGAPGSLEQLLCEEPHLADLTVRTGFSDGELMGREGQPCDRLFVVREGLVALYRDGAEGSRMLALLRPGDVLGEEALSGSRWRTTARALTDVEAFALPASLLPRLTQLYPAVNRLVLQALARRLDMTQRLLSITGPLPAREQVLELLRLITDGSPSRPVGYVAIPPLTQHQIGELLGLARETVARSMAELERAGAIRRSGRMTWLRRHSTVLGLATLLLVRVFTGGPVYVHSEDEAPPPRGRRGRVAHAQANVVTNLIFACGKP